MTIAEPNAAPRREVDLYPAVKAFLEGEGYEVKGEVRGCDLVAVRGDEPPVIVELKLRFTLGLVLQALDRLRLSEMVYLAVPAEAIRRRGIRPLCRRLGLGLIAIHGPRQRVEVEVEPGQYRPPHDRRRTGLLVSEHARRRGDPTPGGVTRVPIMTAYRQEALRIAGALGDGPASVADLREVAAAPNAGRILARDAYGWFERVERGSYRLRDAGRAAVAVAEAADAAAGPVADVRIAGERVRSSFSPHG
ncbi:MAG: DUF2161 family putative PD-(D/E)XK-type phosphodiesterase [Candidatus Limnocylindrales bacterium]|nr:DUF2161 family putative PD-(D/E)XK-type phosphodiesterase [Candidatus Limnocylindrales bacterium]